MEATGVRLAGGGWLPFGAGALAARPVRGALAGGVALLATVLSFYGVMQLLFPDSHLGSFALFWLGAAVVGGPVFGAAGSWWRTGPRAALPVLVLLGVAGWHLTWHLLDLSLLG